MSCILFQLICQSSAKLSLPTDSNYQTCVNTKTINKLISAKPRHYQTTRQVAFKIKIKKINVTEHKAVIQYTEHEINIMIIVCSISRFLSLLCACVYVFLFVVQPQIDNNNKITITTTNKEITRIQKKNIHVLF